MSNQICAGFGERLSRYRKLAGLSAQELSLFVGSLVATRSVIANMENGRVANVTLEKLFALSYALGIPPIALALPLTTPFAKVAIVGSHWQFFSPAEDGSLPPEAVERRVIDLIDWWGWPVFPDETKSTLGGTVARLLLAGLHDLRVIERQHASAVSSGDDAQAALSLNAMNMHAVNLRGLGVDMDGMPA